MVNLTIVCLWEGIERGGIYTNANNLADLFSFLILKKVLKLFFASLKNSAVIQG